MTDKFFGKYRIMSARASFHDYNGGIYFITICTKEKKHYFGEIITGNNGEAQINLSEIGTHITNDIRDISSHYPYAEIPLFVIMPNHIHLIVIINEDNTIIKPQNTIELSMHSISNKKGKLSVVIGGLKSATSKYCREHNIPFDWQERFYDRVIRNELELNNIAQYIENNIAQWAFDEYNQ